MVTIEPEKRAFLLSYTAKSKHDWPCQRFPFFCWARKFTLISYYWLV